MVHFPPLEKHSQWFMGLLLHSLFVCIHFFSFAESGNLLLLVASRNQIVVDNITSQAHSIYSLIRDGRNIVAIDFDSVTGRIYWSDTTQDKIWSAYQNGTDRKIVSLLGSVVFYFFSLCKGREYILYLPLTKMEDAVFVPCL